MSSRAEIVTNYRWATYCYALPFVVGLLAEAIDTVFGVIGYAGLPESLLPEFLSSAFSSLALFGLCPLALAGLFFTSRGWRLAVRSHDLEKKDVGYANFILGGIILMLDLLLLSLFYVIR